MAYCFSTSTRVCNKSINKHTNKPVFGPLYYWRCILSYYEEYLLGILTLGSCMATTVLRKLQVLYIFVQQLPWTGVWYRTLRQLIDVLQKTEDWVDQESIQWITYRFRWTWKTERLLSSILNYHIISQLRFERLNTFQSGKGGTIFLRDREKSSCQQFKGWQIGDHFPSCWSVQR